MDKVSFSKILREGLVELHMSLSKIRLCLFKVDNGHAFLVNLCYKTSLKGENCP